MSEHIRVERVDLEGRNVVGLVSHFQDLFPEKFRALRQHEALEGAGKSGSFLDTLERMGEQEVDAFFNDVYIDDRAAISVGELAVREEAIEDPVNDATDEEFDLLWQARFQRYGMVASQTAASDSEQIAQVIQFPCK